MRLHLDRCVIDLDEGTIRYVPPFSIPAGRLRERRASVLVMTAGEAAVVGLLAAERGKVVERDALKIALGLGPDQDRALNAAMGRVRLLLWEQGGLATQNPCTHRYVRTVRGDGYRFVLRPEDRVEEDAVPPTSEPAAIGERVYVDSGFFAVTAPVAADLDAPTGLLLDRLPSVLSAPDRVQVGPNYQVDLRLFLLHEERRLQRRLSLRQQGVENGTVLLVEVALRRRFVGPGGDRLSDWESFRADAAVAAIKDPILALALERLRARP